MRIREIYVKFFLLAMIAMAIAPAASQAQTITPAGYTISGSDTENGIIALSKEKWRWMADKQADTLSMLFHDKSVFVHMGGSWGKDREVEVIRSGGIHYKHAEVYETSVQLIGSTAILLSRIRLLAVVGGNEVTNPFIVTEVYVKEGNAWKLGSLSFTRTMVP